MGSSADRLPPHSEEAEQGVLGCLLLDPARLPAVQARLRGQSEAFYDLRHRTLFGVLCRMQESRKPIDTLTLFAELRAGNRMDDTGGMEYVASLQDKVPSAANLEYYLESLTEKWRLRRLVMECQSVIESVHQNGQPAETLIGDAELRLHGALTDDAPQADDAVGWQELLGFDVSNDPNCLLGVRDGVTTRYICRGYGAWLVGPSGIGKSSLMFQLGTCWAAGKAGFGIAAARPLRILIVQAENDRGDLSEQVRGIHEGLGLDWDEQALRHVQQNIRVRSVRGKIGAAFCSWLRGEIQSHAADLVLVDPLLSFAGIDVSRQDQCSQFLRVWLDPVLSETGAALISVHHTGKPKAENGRPPQTIHDRMYAGLGSSELVNWARAVMLIEPAGDSAFRLILAKRGKRAGATHPDGEPTHLVWLKHASQGIFWEQIPPPQEKPHDGPARGQGRPSAVSEIMSLNLKPFIAGCPDEGEGRNAIATRLQDWLEANHGRADSEPTCRRAIAAMVKAGKLKNVTGTYYAGDNK